MNIGDKVVYGGITQIILKIEDGQARIRQARRNYLQTYCNTVPLTALQPYSPMPKVSTHAKTCQICGRLIHAATGKIAHHGYERPGTGWQTASCWGARHLPFEVSRDELGEYMRHLVNSLLFDRQILTGLRTGTKLVIMSEVKTDSLGRTVMENGKRVYHDVNYMPGDEGYSKALAVKIAQVEQSFRQTAQFYRWQHERFTNWKPKA